MDQIKDVYVLDDEIKRLKNQNQLLEEYEGPVYNHIFRKKRGQAVLDIGCNNGMKTVERFDRKEIESVTGIEYHKELVAFANTRYKGEKFVFYQADLEDSGLEMVLKKDMKEKKITGYDVINISFVLMHLKEPEKLLCRLKKYLKKNGTMMIIDAEDRFSTMVPDEQKRMKLFLDICLRDPLSGNRHSGEKIKRYLKKSGYHKIVVHSKCVNAKEKEKEKKELIFDTFFSYLPLDYAYLCETEPEDSDYFGIKRKVKQHYAIFRKEFVEKSVYVACGVMIFTCCR